MKLFKKIINTFRRKPLKSNNTKVFINDRELTGITDLCVSSDNVYVDHICLERDHWYNTGELANVRVITSDLCETMYPKMQVKNWTLRMEVDSFVRLGLHLENVDVNRG